MIDNKEYILYLGNFLNEKIVGERKLPTNNPAGSNRMNRIAQALTKHYTPIIVSPGVSFRIKFNKKKTIYNKILTHNKGVIIFFAKALAIPYWGLIHSYFSYFNLVIRLTYRTKLKYIIIYNFDPQLAFIVFVLRLIKPKLKIINNIEDISMPNFNDFKKTSEDRPLQQIIFYLCMKFIAKLSSCYIIPTKRFKKFLPKNKSTLVVTGCIKVNKNISNQTSNKLIVLFSGKIAIEHGIDIFIKALDLLVFQNKYKDKFTFLITGGGHKATWLKEQVNNLKPHLDITYFGFVSNQEYVDLLNKTQVCVALQKETGRHSNFKTPSKVYEYLGNSKLVIATNVGDLAALPQGLMTICDPLTAENLIQDLISLTKIKKLEEKQKQIGLFAYKNYDLVNVGDKINLLISNKI
ncbi:glycosyltransferase [Pseudotamlana carrageenivorans]|uniref:Glycosyl transferase family 1 domain-containing protein n=1 Tax=Pseudotamlana carrageenivorans TaxID=2069432 RepID=A0A2I7SJ07_9FLAO|nr:glycosyltransferase [Tamlana carrageenivorans]AUS05834.1 hypothetical protein C1A40_10340 [Tamlana carrageenivorans]